VTSLDGRFKEVIPFDTEEDSWELIAAAASAAATAAQRRRRRKRRRRGGGGKATDKKKKRIANNIDQRGGRGVPKEKTTTNRKQNSQESSSSSSSSKEGGGRDNSSQIQVVARRRQQEKNSTGSSVKTTKQAMEEEENEKTNENNNIRTSSRRTNPPSSIPLLPPPPPITFEDKQQLFQEIHQLPTGALDDVVKVIQKFHPHSLMQDNGDVSSKTPNGEVEIDIGLLSNQCLWELQRLIAAVRLDKLEPKVGMHLTVWFSTPPKWFGGCIKQVSKISEESWKLTIAYYDEEEEVTVYPDPDGHIILKRQAPKQL